MKKKTERTRNSRIKQHFRVVYSLLFNNIPEPFYILKIVFIFSTLFFAYSSNTDKENLIDNQELPKLIIITFILTTFTSNSRVILTLEGKRVKKCLTVYLGFVIYMIIIIFRSQYNFKK